MYEEIFAGLMLKDDDCDGGGLGGLRLREGGEFLVLFFGYGLFEVFGVLLIDGEVFLEGVGEDDLDHLQIVRCF